MSRETPMQRIEQQLMEISDELDLTYDEVVAAIKELRAENAAMRPIVEAVAEAAVGDEYGGGSWLMFAGYRAETIREQAQTFIAAHSALGRLPGPEEAG